MSLPVRIAIRGRGAALAFVEPRTSRAAVALLRRSGFVEGPLFWTGSLDALWAASACTTGVPEAHPACWGEIEEWEGPEPRDYVAQLKGNNE